MEEVTFNAPSWAIRLYHLSAGKWAAVILVVTVALLASIAVEIIKRRYSAKKQEELAKKTVAWLLVAFSTLFTVLSYVIFFVQSNTDLLNSVPFVGQHVTEALGIAYALYNFRLNKWYQSVATRLGSWSSKKEAEPTSDAPSEQPQQPMKQLDPETESPFEG